MILAQAKKRKSSAQASQDDRIVSGQNSRSVKRSQRPGLGPLQETTVANVIASSAAANSVSFQREVSSEIQPCVQAESREEESLSVLCYRFGPRAYPGACCLSKKNILHQLSHRSMFGTRTSIREPSRDFKRTSYLHTLRSSGSSNRGVQSLVWNKDGTLLAAHSGTLVHVYDVHLIDQSEIQTRNEFSKEKRIRVGSNTVQPILFFPVPKLAGNLHWHRFRSNTLVATVWDQKVLLLFDIKAVATWFLGGMNGQVPCERLSCNIGDRNAAVLVLRDTIFCSDKSNVYAYAICANEGATKTLWQLRTAEPIRKIELLGERYLLLMSESEQVSIVDWTKTECTAMTSQVRPAVVHAFQPLVLGARPQLRPNIIPYFHCSRIMCDSDSSLFKCIWVSSYGWAFSTILDLEHPHQSDSTTLVCTQEMRKVKSEIQKVEKSDGTTVRVERLVPVGTMKGRWSLPSGSVAAVGTGRHICIESIQESVLCVGAHDKYTIGHGPEVRSIGSKHSFKLRAVHGGNVSNIILSRGKPTCVAIHPRHEDMVLVGTLEHGVQLFTRNIFT